MATVVAEMPPFRHEFYALAIKAEGDGKAVSGHFSDFPEGATIFFNSPFQIISWDIVPNWSGYYLMFSQDFVAQSRVLDQMLDHFPFLKIDQSIPFEIPAPELERVLAIYQAVWDEYNGTARDKFHVIEAQVFLLLTIIKRLFEQQVDAQEAKSNIKTADLKLLSRYQTLIQASFYPEAKLQTFANLHSTSYYAEKLNIHPNHLNAVVKRITGSTALSFVHNHLLTLAKSYLVQTEWSVKEIAFDLHFESPNNFSSFFKRHTGFTPLQYRQKG